MTDAPQNPLAAPDPWNLVADGYVTDTMPLFEKYATRALELAELAPASWVLDVACGPGTLSVLAAKQGHRVSAIDFAPAMVEHLRGRAKQLGLTIDAQIGDGQALPHPDASFEGAFSMFGLIFFPDQQQGFRELARVLKPGGRAVVSSWTPAETVPVLVTMFGAMKEALPGLPFGNGKAPLGDPDELRDEMKRAGFGDVEVHPVSFDNTAPNAREFWESSVRGSVPLVMIRQKLGEAAWPAFCEKMLSHLERELGSGPVSMAWTANVGVGHRPKRR